MTFDRMGDRCPPIRAFTATISLINHLRGIDRLPEQIRQPRLPTLGRILRPIPETLIEEKRHPRKPL